MPAHLSKVNMTRRKLTPMPKNKNQSNVPPTVCEIAKLAGRGRFYCKAINHKQIGDGNDIPVIQRPFQSDGDLRSKVVPPPTYQNLYNVKAFPLAKFGRMCCEL